uniref:Uncharacterized protein n=1 Tax=viral metagenome TaxID=1070528 RepID=A0A6M3JNV1_9ZZZZ
MTTEQARDKTIVLAAWRVTALMPPADSVDLNAVADYIVDGVDEDHAIRRVITEALMGVSRVARGVLGRDASGLVELPGEVEIYWRDDGGCSEWCDAADADPDSLAELIDVSDD